MKLRLAAFLAVASSNFAFANNSHKDDESPHSGKQNQAPPRRQPAMIRNEIQTLLRQDDDKHRRYSKKGILQNAQGIKHSAGGNKEVNPDVGILSSGSEDALKTRYQNIQAKMRKDATLSLSKEGVIQNNGLFSEKEKGADFSSTGDPGKTDVGILGSLVEDYDDHQVNDVWYPLRQQGSIDSRNLLENPNNNYSCQGFKACANSSLGTSYPPMYGNNTCRKACYGVALKGFFQAGNSTCIGLQACYDVCKDRYASFQAGHQSCDGSRVCHLAGRQGTFQIVDGTCLGIDACRGAAEMATGSFEAGSSSCVGLTSCWRGGSEGTFKVGDRSCVEKKACFYGGVETGGQLVAGSDSCVGKQACMVAATFNAPRQGIMAIGNMSCRGENSCFQEYVYGETPSFFNFTVGDNSCGCDNCCENLMAGSIIGDCQCNSLDNGCSNADSPILKPENDCLLLNPGYYSCRGFEACTGSLNLVDDFKYGNNTCNGEKACYFAAGQNGSLEAGNSTCVGKSCCRLAGYDGTFFAGHGSCAGTNACFKAAFQNGTFVAADGSCMERKSCERAAYSDGSTFDAGHESCVGTRSCAKAGYNGMFQILDSSCLYDYACYRAGTNGNFTAGTNACTGTSACLDAAFNGTFYAGHGTCQEYKACFGVSEQAGGTFKAGHETCIGPYACHKAAYEGTVTLGDRTCLGDSACYTVGFRPDLTFSAGSDSCVGDRSCRMDHYLFSYSPGTVTIGDASCIGTGACWHQIYDVHVNFTIGDHSCACERCCENLREGSIIGDCQCNSLDDGCSNADGPVIKPGSLCSFTFNETTNLLKLQMDNVAINVDLSPLDNPAQDLNFDNETMKLSLTDSEKEVDLSSLASQRQDYQNLTFNDTTHLLGLTNSDVKVDIAHLVNDGMDEIQDLALDNDTNILSLTNSSKVVDLSRLSQDLVFDNATMQLRMTDSEHVVDLSALANTCPTQNSTLDENSQTLGLTDSNVTLSLSHLLNDDENEIQDLQFNNKTNELSLTNSTNVVDLSHLDKELTFDDENKRIGLTGSHVEVDLSSLRITTLPASIRGINGAKTVTTARRNLADSSSERRLKSAKREALKVSYGGEESNGFTLISAGRLLGMSITARYRLTKGTFKVGLVNCTDETKIESLGSSEDVLVLEKDGARNDVLKFTTPIHVQAGIIVCFEPIRMDDVDSEDENENVASLVLMLEQ